MNEVFCVMECHGSVDDIMPTLIAIFSGPELAMDCIKQILRMDDKVILRVDRWDVDGPTSESLFILGPRMNGSFDKESDDVSAV